MLGALGEGANAEVSGQNELGESLSMAAKIEQKAGSGIYCRRHSHEPSKRQRYSFKRPSERPWQAGP